MRVFEMDRYTLEVKEITDYGKGSISMNMEVSVPSGDHIDKTKDGVRVHVSNGKHSLDIDKISRSHVVATQRSHGNFDTRTYHEMEFDKYLNILGGHKLCDLMKKYIDIKPQEE